MINFIIKKDFLNLPELRRASLIFPFNSISFSFIEEAGSVDAINCPKLYNIKIYNQN